MLLFALVGFTSLADAADSQLSGKLVGSAQLTIHHCLQCKLMGRLFRKSDFCHRGSCLVKGVHGVKQSLMLFSGWVKLQEHRLFHAPSIHPLMKAALHIKSHFLGTLCAETPVAHNVGSTFTVSNGLVQMYIFPRKVIGGDCIPHGFR
jgi:hypothetical protein